MELHRGSSIRFALLLLLTLSLGALDATSGRQRVGTELPGPGSCVHNADCPQDEICYLPAATCQSPCDIYCFAPDPVCGDDGVTYPCGESDALCHGAQVSYTGKCLEQPCAENADCATGRICFPPTQTCQAPCDISCFQPDPVCGSDGRTYSCGEADAHCHGATVEHEGACQSCVCPEIYAPVCGSDGQTYGNACEAGCVGVEIKHEGVCPTDCEGEGLCAEGQICYPPTQTCQPPCEVLCVAPDPVCGTDGQTYTCGEPDAHCHGAEVAHEGSCDRPCLCPQVYDPVCGRNDRTYGNRCLAWCAGTEVAHEGPCRNVDCRSNLDCPRGQICHPLTDRCRKPCDVTCTVADPVCGSDGITYLCGEAQAHCHGAEVVHAGECICREPSCVCPQVYDPVCGEDGVTYGNACEAGCAGVGVVHSGECTCACPLVYDPVCGSDGQTYGNSCEAFCADVEVAHPGECAVIQSR